MSKTFDELLDDLNNSDVVTDMKVAFEHLTNAESCEELSDLQASLKYARDMVKDVLKELNQLIGK